MKAYIISLVAGLLVGLAYGIFGVRSPAPPVVALVGLLGMLLGEQIAPLVRQSFPTGDVALKADAAPSFREQGSTGVDDSIP